MAVPIEICNRETEGSLSSAIDARITEVAASVPKMHPQQVSCGLTVAASVLPDSRIHQIKVPVTIDVSQCGSPGQITFANLIGLRLKRTVAVPQKDPC